MPRTVAILAFEDNVVESVVTGLENHQDHTYSVRSVRRFNSLESLIAAIAELKSESFDTLVFVTHGTPPVPAPPGDVQYFAQTAHSGVTRLTHWYELKVYLEELDFDNRALAGISCYSSQAESYDALNGLRPIYAIAAAGSVTPQGVILGLQAFFRDTAQMTIDELLKVSLDAIKSINTVVWEDSKHTIDAWVPPAKPPQRF